MALQQEIYRIPTETPLPQVRKDSLPEGSIYRDEGCSIAPECLKCPLPQCRHEGFGLVATQRSARDLEIREMRLAGFRVNYIAQHFQINTRTVYRATHGQESSR